MYSTKRSSNNVWWWHLWKVFSSSFIRDDISVTFKYSWSKFLMQCKILNSIVLIPAMTPLITYSKGTFTALNDVKCHSKYDSSIRSCVNYPVVTSPVPRLLSALWLQRSPGLSGGHRKTTGRTTWSIRFKCEGWHSI